MQNIWLVIAYDKLNLNIVFFILTQRNLNNFQLKNKCVLIIKIKNPMLKAR
jgi:hypothetical protein